MVLQPRTLPFYLHPPFYNATSALWDGEDEAVDHLWGSLMRLYLEITIAWGCYIMLPPEAFEKGFYHPADDGSWPLVSLLLSTPNSGFLILLRVRSAPTRLYQQTVEHHKHHGMNESGQKELHMRRKIPLGCSCKGNARCKGPDPCNGSGTISGVNASTSARRGAGLFVSVL